MAYFTDWDQCDTASASRAGFTLTARIAHDDTQDALWENEDGHGNVRRARAGYDGRYDKAPGELVLWDERGEALIYDFADACRTARKDGWGSIWPYRLVTKRQRGGAWIATASAPRRYNLPDIASKPRRNINRAIGEIYEARKAQLGTARAYAANAARADYEHLRAWANDDWRYVGVIVTASRAGVKLGSASLWGMSSDDADYLLETANDLADEAISDAREALATLNSAKE